MTTLVLDLQHHESRAVYSKLAEIVQRVDSTKAPEAQADFLVTVGDQVRARQMVASIRKTIAGWVTLVALLLMATLLVIIWSEDAKMSPSSGYFVGLITAIAVLAVLGRTEVCDAEKTFAHDEAEIARARLTLLYDPPLAVPAEVSLDR